MLDISNKVYIFVILILDDGQINAIRVQIIVQAGGDSSSHIVMDPGFPRRGARGGGAPTCPIWLIFPKTACKCRMHVFAKM